MNGSRQNRGARIRINNDGRALRHIPVGDLILQIELQVATKKDIVAYCCPCSDCCGGC